MKGRWFTFLIKISKPSKKLEFKFQPLPRTKILFYFLIYITYALIRDHTGHKSRQYLRILKVRTVHRVRHWRVKTVVPYEMLWELRDLRLKTQARNRWDTVGLCGMRGENYHLSPERWNFLNFSSWLSSRTLFRNTTNFHWVNEAALCRIETVRTAHISTETFYLKSLFAWKNIHCPTTVVPHLHHLYSEGNTFSLQQGSTLWPQRWLYSANSSSCLGAKMFTRKSDVMWDDASLDRGLVRGAKWTQKGQQKPQATPQLNFVNRRVLSLVICNKKGAWGINRLATIQLRTIQQSEQEVLLVLYYNFEQMYLLATTDCHVHCHSYQDKRRKNEISGWTWEEGCKSKLSHIWDNIIFIRPAPDLPLYNFWSSYTRTVCGIKTKCIWKTFKF